MTVADLVARHEGVARVVAGRVVAALRAQGFAADYEDALQGARIGLWKAAEKYDPDAHGGTPFHLYAWRNAATYARHEAHRSAGLTVSRGDGFRTSDVDDLVGADVPWTEDADVADAVSVRQALSLLPEREREVVFLTFWRDLGPSAVGEAVGLSKSGARLVLARALAQLRADLEEAA